jgi:PST family polysaccharide transporter
LAALAPELIAVVFGAQWAAAALPLMLLALCTPVRSLAPLLPQILNATGDSRYAMRINLVAAVLLPLGFIIGSFAGTAGVAATWVLLYPLIVAPLALRVARRIGLSAREYLSATGPAILGSILMGLAVSLVRTCLPGSWPPGLRLALLAVFGVAIFSGVMLTLFRTRTKEYIAGLKKLRRS